MDDKAIRLIAEQCGYKIEEVTPEKILEGEQLHVRDIAMQPPLTGSQIAG